jgi:hypothetical protein
MLVAALSLLLALAGTRIVSDVLEVRLSVPWGFVPEAWVVFLSTLFASALVISCAFMYPRLPRFFGWRMFVATGVAVVLYAALGTVCGLWPDPPGRL